MLHAFQLEVGKFIVAVLVVFPPRGQYHGQSRDDGWDVEVDIHCFCFFCNKVTKQKVRIEGQEKSTALRRAAVLTK